MTGRTLFDTAQQYTNRGYTCVPCSVWLDENGNKKAQFPDEYRGVVFDQREQWDGFTGLAINTALSGIVVVDIDKGPNKDGWAGLREAGITLPPTPMKAWSQSGGEHWFYRRTSVPVDQSSGLLARDVDVRGDASGILYAYPTVVENGGGAYTMQDAGPVLSVKDLPEFPVELAEMLRQKRGPKRRLPLPPATPPDDVTAAQRDRLMRIVESKLDEIRDAPPGGRFDASRAAMRVIGIGKTLGEVEEMAQRIREEFPGDDDQIEGSIERAILNADAEVLPEDDARGFWDQRPELKHIQTAAYARYGEPWAVLGCVLVRVLSDVPVHVRLDTGVSEVADSVPNLYVALAGEPGDGKSVAMSIAKRLWFSTAETHSPGSGQVIQDWFIPDELGNATTSVIVGSDELSNIGKASGAAGATHIPMLCAAWAGADLNNTTKQSKSTVTAGSYRIGLIGGIQPANAKMLLGAEATGTGLAQRVVWFDTRKCLPNVLPQHPGLIPRVSSVPFPEVVTYCQTALRDIDRWQRASHHDPLDKHSMFNRVKVAYALAVLNGHHDSVRDEDWELAGIVMEHSARTRQWVLRSLAEVARKGAEHAGKLQGTREAVAAETKHDRDLRRVADWIVRKREEFPDITDGVLKNKLRSDKRTYFEEALELLSNS